MKSYFAQLRLWLVMAFTAVVSLINSNKAAAITEANAYTDSLAGGLKTSVSELEAQQLATSQKVDNLAIYAKNTEAIGFTAQSGLTETIQNVIGGTIPSGKTLYIISVGGAFGETSMLKNGEKDYLVDNGDTLLVACSNGAIVDITHTDDRTSTLAVSIEHKFDDLKSGMPAEMALWKAQLEAAVPGLILGASSTGTDVEY
jgi:hypothetical protein